MPLPEDKMTEVYTYSAESAGRMDIGERWELRKEGEKDMELEHYSHLGSIQATTFGWPWRAQEAARNSTELSKGAY